MSSASPSRHPRKPPIPPPLLGAQSPLAKGATARAAVNSPRLNSPLAPTHARRSSLRVASPNPDPMPDKYANGTPTLTKDNLASALRRESEEREELAIRYQDLETQNHALLKDVDILKTTLRDSEARLNEFYSDQARMEDELAAQQAIIDKLREQTKELERDKRDISRRYSEQAATFEAERQAFYDNEQHLKSRIQSLTQARKAPETPRSGRKGDLDRESIHEEAETLEESLDEEPDIRSRSPIGVDSVKEEDIDTPEVSALKLELSTLSTSYASIQNTLHQLTSQLGELQRVNNQLQDENESYNILLREKTMSGQFDFLRNLRVGDESAAESDADGRSIMSNSRSTLDRVSEMEELGMDEDDDMAHSSELDPFHDRPSSPNSSHAGRRKRSGSASPMPIGESLAGLGLTGPGLDLAAELGRAESRDPNQRDIFNESPARLKGKKNARGSEAKGGHAPDVDALRTEVKSLKDANKALSLYASKIIDRIIAQEGFEHVLAIDYNESAAKSPQKPAPPPPRRLVGRPQSLFFGGSATESETTRNVDSSSRPSLSGSSDGDKKQQRRSMSFDWKSLSPWSAGERKPENPNLRPLTLRPGAVSVVNARKLETQEDEEDRIERERLAATMKLMGIAKPESQTSVISSKDSEPATARPSTSKGSNRWSWFLGKSTSNEESEVEGPPLTAEALQHSNAAQALKQLDEHERARIEDISKGSPSGFTEIKPRGSLSDEWRSRRDARLHGSTGSGSTVWSAGREDGKISGSGSPQFGSP